VKTKSVLQENPFIVQITDISTQRTCHTHQEVPGNALNFSIEKASSQDQVNHLWSDSKNKSKIICRVLLLALSLVLVGSSLLAICLLIVPNTSPEFKPKPCDRGCFNTHLNSTAEKTMVLRNINGSIRESLRYTKHNIVQLDLSFNRISFMNFSELNDFAMLRALRLSNNLIRRTNGIDRIQRLQWLDVSSNRLQGIDELHKHSKTSVRFLNISGNRIFRLHVTDFTNFPHLEFLDISNNPIRIPSVLLSARCSLDSICKIQFKSSHIFLDCSHVVNMLPKHTIHTLSNISLTKVTSKDAYETINETQSRTVKVQVLN
jgi:Leucine-rich repeat (LRR) protein